MKAKIILAFLLSLSFSVSAAPDLKKYHKNAELTCVDCHAKSQQKSLPDQQVCLDCHGGMDEIVKAGTQPASEYHDDLNPHYSKHYSDSLSCIACHREHSESKIYCNQCHMLDYENFKE